VVRAGDPAGMLEESPVAPPIVELGRWAGWSPLPLSVRDARRAARGLSLVPPVPRVAASGDQVLEARGLSVSYGRLPALRSVGLTLARGEVVALMGRNGSGKSTLLWALQGTRRRTAGSVRVAGSDPAALDAEARRRLVGLVPQTAADLLYLESVDEECAAADRDAGRQAGHARSLLDRLAPGIDGGHHPRDLSEGQRLALVLAILLTSEPEVVALDEPTRGLDYPGQEALAGILASLTAEGRAVLVATHDVEFVARVADRVVVLSDGEVVSAGPTAKVVAESPAFAPQVLKILGDGWLTVDQVREAAG
jgi:energy-coupling factor transporter ATP-binding protein EcfA2